MEEYINHWLSDKTFLYKWLIMGNKYFEINDDLGLVRPDKCVIQLLKKKYRFTQKQFDKLLDCLMYGDNCCLTNDLKNNYKFLEPIMTVFFSLYSPNYEQLDQLLELYDNYNIKFIDRWKKYIGDEYKIGYIEKKINDTITYNNVELFISLIINGSDNDILDPVLKRLIKEKLITDDFFLRIMETMCSDNYGVLFNLYNFNDRRSKKYIWGIMKNIMGEISEMKICTFIRISELLITKFPDSIKTTIIKELLDLSKKINFISQSSDKNFDNELMYLCLTANKFGYYSGPICSQRQYMLIALLSQIVLNKNIKIDDKALSFILYHSLLNFGKIRTNKYLDYIHDLNIPTKIKNKVFEKLMKNSMREWHQINYNFYIRRGRYMFNTTKKIMNIAIEQNNLDVVDHCINNKIVPNDESIIACAVNVIRNTPIANTKSKKHYQKLSRGEKSYKITMMTINNIPEYSAYVSLAQYHIPQIRLCEMVFTDELFYLMVICNKKEFLTLNISKFPSNCHETFQKIKYISECKRDETHKLFNNQILNNLNRYCYLAIRKANFVSLTFKIEEWESKLMSTKLQNFLNIEDYSIMKKYDHQYMSHVPDCTLHDFIS